MRPEMNDISNMLGAVERRKAPTGLRERIIAACGEAEPVEAIGCDECLDLASTYLDDELASPTREAFEAHVFACEACYVAFKQMERTAEVLRSVPAAPAPDDLHERITAAVAREAGTRSAFTWRRAAKVLGGLAAAAALLAAIFIPRDADAPDATAPMIAESPAEIATDVTPDPVTDPVEPGEAAEDASEPAEESEAVRDDTPETSRMVARTTPRTRLTSPARSVATSPSHEPQRSAVTPDAARTESVAPRPEAAADSEREETQPRSTRTERPEPRSPERAGTDTPPRTAPSTPAPRSVPEPITTDDVPEPAPAHENVPEVVPEPPARAPQPRESVIAAIPRDPNPDPEPVTASAPTPTRTSSAHAPKPSAESESMRMRVIPTQSATRTYRPTQTPTAQKLALRTDEINSSRSRMDNPPTGIELN